MQGGALPDQPVRIESSTLQRLDASQTWRTLTNPLLRLGEHSSLWVNARSVVAYSPSTFITVRCTLP